MNEQPTNLPQPGTPVEAQNKSEVARLRQKIEEEYQAMQNGFSGLASGIARHDFINRRYRAIDQLETQLTGLIGKNESLSLIIDINDRIAPVQQPGAAAPSP